MDVLGSIEQEYNELFKEDIMDNDDVENKIKTIKNELNNHIKTKYAKVEGKEDETKDKDDDYKHINSVVNLPLISSDGESSHDSSFKGRATSPKSLSSTYKVFPPIMNIHQVSFYTFLIVTEMLEVTMSDCMSAWSQI